MADCKADAERKRKRFVQTLCKLARESESGLAKIADGAAKPRVEEFGKKLLASGKLDADGKTEATAALDGYLATFVDTAGPSAPQQSSKTWRLRGRSFLFTYNWDFLNKVFPDGTACAASHASLWRLWKQWKVSKKQELGVVQSTSTLELSLASKLAGRVHFHWKVNLKEAVDVTSTQMFAFHGVRPDGRPTLVSSGLGKAARGNNFAEASNRVHFYAWAPKLGSLYKGTNWAPWKDYRVQGAWLDALWTDGKLDHATYSSLALKVKVGYESRKRNLQLVLADEREARVDQLLVEVAQAQQNLKAPPRFFQAVRDWEDSFLELRFRWKLLFLVADSASGKSTFAEGLFDNPYVLTVEDSEDLDLRAFNRELHDGIVLDNVNTWQQVLSWRAVLQARNAKSRGAQSKTNVHSYVQYLFGVPVVVTVDLEAPDAHLVQEGNQLASSWLQKNGVFVRLPAGEAFYDKEQLPNCVVENKYSLFAATVKRRRCQERA